VARAHAGIFKWLMLGVTLRFLTLTSAPGADYSRLNRHFEVLVKRIKRSFGCQFEYIKIKTREGNGVLHVIYAGPYIPQPWLSRNWEEIHGAKVVHIRKMYFGKGLRNYLGSYLQDQGRLSYSRGWFKSGWASAYRRIQSDHKCRYVLVSRLGVRPPVFCLRAWSKWFFWIYDPILFEQFLTKCLDENFLNARARQIKTN